MKKTNYIAILGHAFMALAVVGVMTSCADDAGTFDIFHGGNGDGLSVAPVVSEPTLVTRAETTPSVVTLNEELLNTIDVFVEAVDNPGTFIKQYHRTSTDNIDAIGHQVQSLLAENWRAEGLVMGKKYNIYVATNNTQTKDSKDLSTFNVAALKALVADEITDGLALLEEGTGNIAAPWNGQFSDTPSGNIYKQYIPADQIDEVRTGSYNSIYGYTSQKEFMMDGIIKNWTPDATTRDQVFGAESNVLTLNRAAAKIVLNLKFDEEFLHSLTHNKKVVGGTTTWEEKPAAEKCEITGAPAWRYSNFAFGAPVFTPETQGAGVEVHNSATILYHPYDFVIDDNLTDGNSPLAAQIITYTYPNKWDAANYATDAPSLVVSVGFKENGVTNYHYYRIPLVKSDVTAIERNHIYVVNATIATRGSELHEDVDEIKDLHYYVLPWNDESNSAAIHNEVEAVQHLYLKVNPKIYTLRGDGAQSVDINYLKASGTSVGWKLFTYDANGNQTAVVANNADGATRAWFYNSTGAFTTTYSDTGSGITWGNTMGVNITQSNEGVSGTSGKFTVTSQALTNKAIKYIRFRVFLNDDETLYEDVIIRHFPTDNIQNIAGSWSSRHTTGSGTQQTTLTTTVLSEAQSWAEQYGVNFVTEEITTTDYINYAQYAAHAGEEGYTIVNAQSTTNRTTFRTYVQNEDQRRVANGQNNAVLGEDGYSYWGVNPSESWRYYSDYDYRIVTGYDWWGNPNDYDYYRYATIYRARYSHTYTYTQYSLTVEMPGTGQWVDWDRDAGKTYTSGNYKYTRGNNFTAKVYDDSRSRIYAIEPTPNSNNYYTSLTYDIADNYTQGSYYVYTTGGELGTSGGMDLTNNHMYVIQISSTSNEYVLGRPYVDTTTHQSQDDVVSPAFMIASQLGAVTTFTGNNAATNAANHCDSYMEVAKDGTRYTGWRLPTQSEIKVIVGYQEGEINNVTIPTAYQTITPVLTGDLYWCLSGRKVRTADNQIVTDGNAYLRCVRDLSAEEVERLNGFDKIVDKYQNK